MPHKSSGSGIYCIKNLINDKVYIGQALRLERRLYEHKYYLAIGKDKAVALQRAVNKYGLDNFDMSILEYCNPECLNEREIYHISQFNSSNKKFGYNLSSGGNSGLIGYKHSEETKQHMSVAKKGYTLRQDLVEMLRNINLGKVVSLETRKKISEANTGSKHPMWGKHHSEETKQLMRDNRGGDKSYQFGTKKESARSKFYGVYRVPRRGHIYWATYIKIHGERVYIGSSKDEVEVAKMYDEYIKLHNLPNPLNFE